MNSPRTRSPVFSVLRSQLTCRAGSPAREPPISDPFSLELNRGAVGGGCCMAGRCARRGPSCQIEGLLIGHPADLGTDLLASGDGVLREVEDDRGGGHERLGDGGRWSGRRAGGGNDDDRASI